MKTAYLVTYNTLNILGWSLVLFHLIQTGGNPEKLTSQTLSLVFWVQHLALLEILHAVTGLVPSNPFVTTIQVISRVFMLDVFTFQQVSWTTKSPTFFLMVGSWALVEVPRYAFYVAQLLGSQVPSFLFFLRYSLFIVLYPTGISGEVLQQVASYPGFIQGGKEWMVRFSHVVIVLLYVPLGPFMVWSMWVTRKKAYQKRNAEKRPSNTQPQLVWPITNAETKERSTTEVSKKIWAAAARGFVSDPKRGEDEAKRIEKTRDWRWRYTSVVKTHVLMGCTSDKDALGMARAGLAAARASFVFCRGDKTLSLNEILDNRSIRGSPLYFGVIEGEMRGKQPLSKQLVVPYHGQHLSGAELGTMLDLLIKRGTIEPDSGKAIKLVSARESDWLDLSNEYVLMLGASSAMGPFEQLVEHGATVVAVDIPRPKLWESLFEKVRRSHGRIIFPLSKPQKECSTTSDLAKFAGCDMLANTPELLDWCSQIETQGRPLTVGNFTYLDGAAHVQLALAGDLVMERLCRDRKDTRLAFLCTPTDDHVVPRQSQEVVAANRSRAPAWQKLLETFGILIRNDALPIVSGLSVVEAIVSRQGPNYILAKRLQHWRAMVARTQGHIVSSNVAPSTFTLSVVSNPLFKAGYNGWKRFFPLEVMMPDTSNTVMFALLVHDLKNEQSKSHPSFSLSNSLELFSLNSFHGGIWRCAYTVESVGAPAAVSWYLETYGPLVFVLIGVVGSAAWYVAYGLVFPVVLFSQ